MTHIVKFALLEYAEGKGEELTEANHIFMGKIRTLRRLYFEGGRVPL